MASPGAMAATNTSSLEWCFPESRAITNRYIPEPPCGVACISKVASSPAPKGSSVRPAPNFRSSPAAVIATACARSRQFLTFTLRVRVPGNCRLASVGWTMGKWTSSRKGKVAGDSTPKSNGRRTVTCDCHVQTFSEPFARSVATRSTGRFAGVSPGTVTAKLYSR